MPTSVALRMLASEPPEGETQARASVACILFVHIYIKTTRTPGSGQQTEPRTRAEPNRAKIVQRLSAEEAGRDSIHSHSHAPRSCLRHHPFSPHVRSVRRRHGRRRHGRRRHGRRRHGRRRHRRRRHRRRRIVFACLTLTQSWAQTSWAQTPWAQTHRLCLPHAHTEKGVL